MATADLSARDELSPYEKCLFCWTEVNMFGLEFEQRFSALPFLGIKAEEVLSGNPCPLARLLAFMDLPWDEHWVERTHRLVDRWHHHTNHDVDPLQVHDHPGTVATAARLGYDVFDLDLNALVARYRREPDPGIDRIGPFAQ